MTDDNGLLAHLAWRFPGATEDIATEALAYILNKHEDARTALAELLTKSCGDPAEVPSEFKTQQGFKGGRRPDLVGYNNKNQPVVLVESKFWAGFTPNQPNGYLRLATDPKSTPDQLSLVRHLLFLVPSNGRENRWKELCTRARNRGFALGEETLTNDVFSNIATHVIENSQCYLMLTDWKNLFRHMKKHGIEMNQLEDLCRQTEEEETIRNEELESLINKVICQSEKYGYIDTKGLGTGKWYGYYGRYIGFIDKTGKELAVAWLGIDWGRPDTPLHLAFIDNNKRFKPEQMKAIAGNLWAKWPSATELKLPIRDDYVNNLTSIVKKLGEARDTLARPPQ